MKYDAIEETITGYKAYNIPQPIGYFNLAKVIGLIKSDRFKKPSEEIRELYSQGDDPKIKNQIEVLKKNELGGVGFNGKFSQRGNDYLIEPSGLCVLDFDDGPCPAALNPYILLRYKSPRGRDKVVIRIPLVKNNAQYREYFRAVQYFIIKAIFGDVKEKNVERAIKKFKSPLDGSGCDLARFTYLSYDPEPYFNPDAMIWTQRFIIEVKKAGTTMKEPKTSMTGPMQQLQKLFYNYNPSTGSRHEICLKLGRLAGGWVAGGLLNKEEVFNMAENAIYTFNDGDEHGAKDDIRTFNDAFIVGMQMPMNVYHEKNTIKKVESFKQETKIEADEDERMKKAMDAAAQEEGDGFLTGWDSLDQIYKVFPRTSTLIYSQPNVGKTLFLFTLAVSMSKQYSAKWFVYSPETGREGTVAIRIAEVYTGKDASRSNKMSKEELALALKWVHEHFFIYERSAQQPRPSVNDILLACDDFTAKTGTKINYVIIDTLSNTTIETEGRNNRIDLAYEAMLDGLGQWMFDRDIHVFLTSHMTNVGHIAVDKATGHLIDPTPNFTMIKGGQALPRMGFNVIALHQHRPATFQPSNVPLEYNGNLYFNNSFYAIIQKIKPFYVGRRGMVHFRVDYAKHKIYDVDAGEIREETMDIPYRDATQSAVEAQRQIEWTNPYDNDEPDWTK